jgi:hypothetical protein
VGRTRRDSPSAKLTKRWLTRSPAVPIKATGWTSSDAGSLVVILIGVSFGWRLIIGSGLGGLALAAGFRLVAVASMGCWKGWRGTATSQERSALREAVVFGSLLAFVISLALGRFVSVSQLALLGDGVTTLAIVMVMQAVTRRAHGHEPRDSWLTEAFRNRIVLATLPSGWRYAGLEHAIRALSPARLFIGRPGDNLQWIDDIRPTFVLVVDDQGDRRRAALTRRLANQSLRLGVEALVLVSVMRIEQQATYSERIVRALAGLTSSRLIRIRVDAGAINANAARQILQTLALAENGLRYPLSSPEIEDDAAILWAELDAV